MLNYLYTKFNKTKISKELVSQIGQIDKKLTTGSQGISNNELQQLTLELLKLLPVLNETELVELISAIHTKSAFINHAVVQQSLIQDMLSKTSFSKALLQLLQPQVDASQSQTTTQAPIGADKLLFKLCQQLINDDARVDHRRVLSFFSQEWVIKILLANQREITYQTLQKLVQKLVQAALQQSTCEERQAARLRLKEICRQLGFDKNQRVKLIKADFTQSTSKASVEELALIVPELRQPKVLAQWLTAKWQAQWLKPMVIVATAISEIFADIHSEVTVNIREGEEYYLLHDNQSLLNESDFTDASLNIYYSHDQRIEAIINDKSQQPHYLAIKKELEQNLQLVSEKPLNLFIDLLNKATNNEAKGEIMQLIGDMVSKNSKLANCNLLYLLSPFISANDKQIGRSVCSTLARLIKANPKLIDSAFLDTLIARLDNSDKLVRLHVLIAIRISLEANPKLASYDIINSLLSNQDDENSSICYCAKQTIINILHNSPHLANKELLAQLKYKVDEKNIYLNYISYKERSIKERSGSSHLEIINTLLQLNHELTDLNLLKWLVCALRGSNKGIRTSVHRTIITLLNIQPKFVTEGLIYDLEKQLIFWLRSGYNLRGIYQVLSAALMINPALINDATIKLLKWPQNNNRIQIFTCLVKAQPELISRLPGDIAKQIMTDSTLFSIKPLDLIMPAGLAWSVLEKQLHCSSPPALFDKAYLQRILSNALLNPQIRAPIIALLITQHQNIEYIDELKAHLYSDNDLSVACRATLGLLLTRQNLQLDDIEKKVLAHRLNRVPVDSSFVELVTLFNLAIPSVIARLFNTFVNTADKALQDMIADAFLLLEHSGTHCNEVGPFQETLAILLNKADLLEHHSIIAVLRFFNLTDTQLNGEVSQQLINFYEQQSEADKQKIVHLIPEHSTQCSVETTTTTTTASLMANGRLLFKPSTSGVNNKADGDNGNRQDVSYTQATWVMLS